MKFNVIRTSNYNSEDTIEIEFSTLEDFINWVKEQKEEVVIWGEEDVDGNEIMYLEIYDSWRESTKERGEKQ